MKTNDSAKNILILLVIFSFGFGCKYFSLNKESKVPVETKNVITTVITKDILKERLDKKGIETVSDQPTLKSNPLSLQLRFSNSKTNFKVNQEEFGTFVELVNKLKDIFREREANGVFIEGTNEVYKRITLSAYDDYITDYNAKNIYVEDFEELVDNLRKEDITQIKLDISEPNQIRFSNSGDDPKISDISATAPETNIKTISGGVVNGKATNLVKPVYPSAARAVRASGAVNVQVTIDEKGNVISASAVSGHPLLRAAALQAAKDSKFSPTMLSGKPVRVTGIVVYNFTPE